MRKRNSIQCPKIDENQCRINTIHLTVGEGGGGGGLGQSRCKDCTEKGRTLFEIFLRTVYSDVIQAVACRSCCYVINNHLIEGGGGGGLHTADFFFLPKLRPNIFHSSVTIVINRKGWDKNIPSYTGGWWRMPNSAKLLSRIKAPMQGTLWSTI